jgi:hypothetical protein
MHDDVGCTVGVWFFEALDGLAFILNLEPIECDGI